MNEWLRFGVVAVLMLGGVVAFAIGVLGIYRFRFVLNRMHAAAVLDTMGLFCIALGLAVARGWDAITLKFLLIVVLLWCSSPVSSHLLAKMEYITDRNLSEEAENAPQTDGGNEDDVL